jgi:hypothetical protein
MDRAERSVNRHFIKALPICTLLDQPAGAVKVGAVFVGVDVI